MLSPASPGFASFPGRSILSWNDNESLDDFIAKSLPRCPTTDTSQWPLSFNLNSLNRIGGFEIIWTSHLADHLLMNEDLGTISVYHHAHILQSHQAKAQDISQDVLPRDLLDETLQTLALLLPRAKANCKSWFEKMQRRYPNAIDPIAADIALGTRGRACANYPYWYDRLSVIQRAYNESEPSALPQWWFDRRKKVQWYTFWVAILVLILTIVFGLIQSVTGILQAYGAFRPRP